MTDKDYIDSFDLINGKKYDSGKPRVGLMISDFARALEMIADVTTFGAEKYAPSNWLNVVNAAERYNDALHRHLLKHAQGELLDDESGLTHLSHAAWNILALLELEARKYQ